MFSSGNGKVDAGTVPRTPYPAALVDRLLAVIAGINADLDHDVVLRRICRACVEVAGADAAGFISCDDAQARLVAGVGFPAAIHTITISRDDAELLSLASRPRRLTLTDAHRQLAHRPDLLTALTGLNTVVVTPVFARSQVVGALVVAFAPLGHPLDAEQRTLLDLLAGHGGAAIANAVAFEDAVRRQAHEKAVIDAVADGVATLDGEGRVTSWNRAAAELTGLRPDQVLGHTAPFPVGGPQQPVEHRIDDDRWLEIVATPLEAGRVVVLHDISRQKALDTAKAMFVAAASHELKTPLTVITSYANWLRDHGESAEPTTRKTAYEAIADSADDLYRIVEKVLLTAKTEAGPIDLRPQRLDPDQLVRAAAAPFAFPGGRHELRLEIAPDLPAIWADPQALRTVLGQLLENAVKYSPDGGTIVVLVERARHRHRPDRAMVRFAVSDAGIGLAPAEIAHLFAPFYQGQSRRGIRGGVGLGLSIVRRLVEGHGGECGASGELDRGSQFWVTVAVAEDEQHDLA